MNSLTISDISKRQQNTALGLNDTFAGDSYSQSTCLKLSSKFFTDIATAVFRLIGALIMVPKPAERFFLSRQASDGRGSPPAAYSGRHPCSQRRPAIAHKCCRCRLS